MNEDRFYEYVTPILIHPYGYPITVDLSEIPERPWLNVTYNKNETNFILRIDREKINKFEHLLIYFFFGDSSNTRQGNHIFEI